MGKTIDGKNQIRKWMGKTTTDGKKSGNGWERQQMAKTNQEMDGKDNRWQNLNQEMDGKDSRWQKQIREWMGKTVDGKNKSGNGWERQ